MLFVLYVFCFASSLILALLVAPATYFFVEDVFVRGRSDLDLPVYALVLVLLWALVFGLTWLGLRIRRRDLRKSHPSAPSRSAFICGQCGDDALVRGPNAIGFGWRNPCIVRCLTCGLRRRVPREIWKQLAEPNPGDPFETPQDRMYLANRQPLTMRSLALFVATFGGCLGAAWVLSIAVQSYVPQFQAFVVCVGVSWGLCFRLWARWTQPARRPGRRCVGCGYDLRGAGGTECPECGHAFDRSLLEAEIEARQSRPSIR